MIARDFGTKTAFLEEVGRYSTTELTDCAGLIDKEDRLPIGLLAQLASRRLLALDRLQSAGQPLTARERLELILLAIETIAQSSASVAKLVLDHNLGQIDMLQALASRDLLDDYLPKIRGGELQVAFLMSEPHGGSQTSRLTCSATRDACGWRLTGKKDWVTGAAARLLFLVVARAEGSGRRFGLFLVDRSASDFAEGSVAIAKKRRHLGLRGLGHYEVAFNRTAVPARHVLLEPTSSGLREIMRLYNHKRCGQAAMAIGISRASLERAYDYLRQRHPGRHGGLAFQNAAFVCAEMFTHLEAATHLCQSVLSCSAEKHDGVVACSMAKLFATEVAVWITNTAVQLCGAAGTCDELPLERFMRDARMLTIAGGTSEALKLTIARHLELLRAAP